MIRLSVCYLISVFALITAWPGVAADEEPAARKFYLPSNPRAAAYMLGRLSNAELIAAPRGEFVYVALLQRAGLDRKYRVEALEGLAKARGTDGPTECLQAMKELDAKGEDAEPVLRELGEWLLKNKPEVLSAKRDELIALAADAQGRWTRELAWAGVITGDGSGDKAWQEAEGDEQKLAAVVGALPWLNNASLRRGWMPRLDPLLSRAAAPELQQAAVLALSSVPGGEAEAFARLAGLVKEGTQPSVALTSLQRLPKSTWPPEQVPPLVETLLAYMKGVPTEERTQDDYLGLMQFASDLGSRLPPEKGAEVERILSGLGVRVIVIRTIYEQMLYDKRKFVVEAGKPVQVILENPDAMQHNLVIVQPGAMQEIGMQAEKMPAVPDAQGRLNVPDSPKVLWATRMLSTGEKEKLSFNAPVQTGEYPYLCTYPGHWVRMNGTMIVVDNLVDYLAAHPVSEEPKMTEWKLEDFTAELAHAAETGQPAAGKELFASLACLQCHKIGGEGYAFGPELTDVFQRYNNDWGQVLREILEPSLIIQDRYRNYQFETKDDELVTGMIVKEDAETVTIHSGPADALIQTMAKTDLKSRQVQSSSLMPVGLLSLSTKEQIIDLLAFLKSGGAGGGHGGHAH